jgi:hypothetical protein
MTLTVWQARIEIMKLMKMIMALGVFTLMGAVPLLTAQAQQGAKCDDERQICRDKNGLSVELTRQRYGDQAAQRLQRHLSKGEGSGQQPQQPQRPPQPQQPQRPPQPQQPQRPPQPQQPQRPSQHPSGDVFSPTSDVRCVRSEQVCYHYNQPSSIFTRQYFGGAAADRLQYR